MGFSANRLFQFLQQLSSCRSYQIAYSGGLDSHVLLYSLVQLRLQFPEITLRAVHIDHGLNPDSTRWSGRCHEVCTALKVECKVIKVNAHPAKGESPEAAARQARYSALRKHISVGECLLMAQHQDDQVETVLLQLLRGSGPHGLAAMAKTMVFGDSYLLRPLLSFSRSELQDYAKKEGLVWINDPSNQDLSFDRNYLRHEILPLLRCRWPGLGQTVSRAARHQAEVMQLLDQQAHQDLNTINADENWLSVSALRALPPHRCRNLLRYWLKNQGLPLPDSFHLRRILTEVLPALEDRQPVITWFGAEVRRYRDRLYAQLPLPPHNPAIVIIWEAINPLTLPASVGGMLVLRLTQGSGLSVQQLQQGCVTVRFRQGGERIQLVDRGHSHTIKKYFQEQGIPPWQRDRIPMVYIGDTLVL